MATESVEVRDDAPAVGGLRLAGRPPVGGHPAVGVLGLLAALHLLLQAAALLPALRLGPPQVRAVHKAAAQRTREWRENTRAVVWSAGGRRDKEAPTSRTACVMDSSGSRVGSLVEGLEGRQQLAVRVGVAVVVPVVVPVVVVIMAVRVVAVVHQAAPVVGGRALGAHIAANGEDTRRRRASIVSAGAGGGTACPQVREGRSPSPGLESHGAVVRHVLLERDGDGLLEHCTRTPARRPRDARGNRDTTHARWQASIEGKVPHRARAGPRYTAGSSGSPRTACTACRDERRGGRSFQEQDFTDLALSPSTSAPPGAGRQQRLDVNDGASGQVLHGAHAWRQVGQDDVERLVALGCSAGESIHVDASWGCVAVHGKAACGEAPQRV